MRYQFLLLLILSLSSIQCRSNHSVEAKVITLAGRVTGIEKPFSLLYMTRDQHGKMESKGHSFQLSIQDDRPVMISCIYGFQKWDLFAEPGDSIHMEFDHFHFVNFGKSVVYSGDKVLENQRLLALKRSLHYGEEADKGFYIEPESIFVEKMNALSKESEKILVQQILNEEDFSSFFKDWATDYYNFVIALHLEEYFRNIQSTTKRIESIRRLKSSLHRPDIEPTFGIKTEKDKFSITPYRSYLRKSIQNDLYEVAIRESSSEYPFNWAAESLKSVDQKFVNAEVRESAKFEILRAHFANFGTKEIESEIIDFLDQAKDERYIKAIRASMNEWEALAKNTPAPDFSLPDVHGIIHSLENFRGKYIYVDVWATWCGPCLKERPYFEELIARYDGNPNIAFVGISTDKNAEAWEKMVIEKEFKGIQLLAGQDSSFHQDYKIRLIPHFMLIDREGNIVDHHAPKPNSDAIVEILDNLIHR